MFISHHSNNIHVCNLAPFPFPQALKSLQKQLPPKQMTMSQWNKQWRLQQELCTKSSPLPYLVGYQRLKVQGPKVQGPKVQRLNVPGLKVQSPKAQGPKVQRPKSPNAQIFRAKSPRPKSPNAQIHRPKSPNAQILRTKSPNTQILRAKKVEQPLVLCNPGIRGIKTRWKRKPKTRWEDTAKSLLDLTVIFLRKLPKV